MGVNQARAAARATVFHFSCEGGLNPMPQFPSSPAPVPRLSVPWAARPHAHLFDLFGAGFMRKPEIHILQADRRVMGHVLYGHMFSRHPKRLHALSSGSTMNALLGVLYECSLLDLGLIIVILNVFVLAHVLLKHDKQNGEWLALHLKALVKNDG